jgi:hypothetical protein
MGLLASRETDRRSLNLLERESRRGLDGIDLRTAGVRKLHLE